MQEFLNIALSFPTVIWSALTVVALAYWIFVIVGALDIELLDFDLDFDFDGDLDVDVDLEADADADANIDVEGHGAKPLAKLAVALGIGRVPVTILLTILSFSGWAITYFSVLLASPEVSRNALFGIALLLGSVIVGLPLMGALAHPLKGIFKTVTKSGGVELIGQVCSITTGEVSEEFGQARLEDGGAGLLLSVRCQGPNDLRRRSKALIIGHDEKENVYFVEPYDLILGSDETEEATAEAERAESV